ncbi:MAG: ATP synthase F1 subunit delta [Clostridiales bacterium]|nr:ATP synthase F1 subunit delta [Clostridiales bacterium]
MAGLIGKNYGSALFSIAMDEDKQDIILSELTAINNIMNENNDFIKLLNTPSIAMKEKMQVISSAFEERIDENTYNFLCLLTEKGRILYLNEITDEYRRLYNNHYNLTEVKATTAIKLSDDLKGKLVKKLETITGKKVTLIEEINPDIIGGIIIDYDNTQIDASVKTKLDGLRAQIRDMVV